MRAKFVSIEVASSRGVAERWRKQYDRDDGWLNTATGNSKIIYDNLCALGPTPSIEQAAEVIGNKSWSYIFCDGCSDYVERAIRIGEYEGKRYCATCINEAHQALGAQS